MRLFFGIEIPDNVRRFLKDKFKGVFPGVKWVRPDQHHITLLFLGDVPRERYDALLSGARSICSLAPSFSVRLGGLKFLGPTRSPRTFCLDVQDGEALRNLQTRLAESVASRGFKTETRAFDAHVTLARLKNPQSRYLDRLREFPVPFEIEPFEVKHFTLFESALSARGSTYLVRETFELATRG